MLYQFKNPPAQYRAIESDNDESVQPLLVREVKMELDRQMMNTDAPASVHLPKAMHSDSPYFRLFVDYAARVRYALSHGKRRAQVALMKQSNQSRSDFFDFYNMNLPREHLSHDIISEDAIIRATVVDQSLICSSNEYEMLILPPLEAIRYETVLKIQEFVDDGGRVMATMPIPAKDLHGKKHAEIRSIFNEIFRKGPCDGKPVTQLNNGAILVTTGDPHELAPILRDCICMAIKPNVSIKADGGQCRDIAFVHRVCEDAEIFFFANTSLNAHQVQLSIRCDKAPHIFDPETGEQIALINCTQQGSRTILLHKFEGCGSLLLCFDDNPGLAVPTPQFEYGQQITLSDEWNVATEDASTHIYTQKALIPEFLRGQHVIVNLENSPDIVEFIINGAAAGARLWPPYEMDITALVKPGPNEIALKVTNTAPHIIGKIMINIY